MVYDRTAKIGMDLTELFPSLLLIPLRTKLVKTVPDSSNNSTNIIVRTYVNVI